MSDIEAVLRNQVHVLERERDYLRRDRDEFERQLEEASTRIWELENPGGVVIPGEALHLAFGNVGSRRAKP